MIIISSTALHKSNTRVIDFKVLLQNINFPGSNYERQAVGGTSLK
jgi:hypothetical protein